MSNGRVVLICLLLGFFLVFLQGAVDALFVPHHLIPNLPLLLVVFLAFRYVSVLGVTISFFLGLQLDFASGILIGPWAGSFVFTFTLLSWFSRRIFMEGLLASLLVGFGCGVFSGLFYGLLFQGFRQLGDNFFSTTVSQSLVTAVCMPFAFGLCKRLLIRRESSLFMGRGAGSFVAS